MIEVTLTCDGSVLPDAGQKNGGPGRIGMGVVLACPARAIEREFAWGRRLPRATNIRAELEAIEGALLKVRAELRGRTAATVVTDSLWSINAIEGRYRLNHHRELIGVIRSLMGEFTAVTFQHVKGHAGHRQNERCDQLAKDAARQASPDG